MESYRAHVHDSQQSGFGQRTTGMLNGKYIISYSSAYWLYSAILRVHKLMKTDKARLTL